MSEPRPRDAPGPGEVRPQSTGRLDRPPGERYATSQAGQAVVGPRWGRAVLFGLLAAAGGALVWLAAGGVIGVSGGLVVVAAVIAWVIGWAVRTGAWTGRAHASDGRAGVIAIVLGIATWLAGTYLVYLYSLATLPASSLSLAQRIAGTPFVEWLSPQLLPLAPVELLAFVLVGWYAARQ